MADGQSGASALERRASTGTNKGPDPLIGRVVNDRFRIVSLIARGGMGKVYRAEQAPLGREVALKVLNPNYSGDTDPEFHKRFFLEASTCSKLTHPNTVTIFDYGRTDDDVYYIAMELLEGRTLHRTLRDEGPFAPGRAMHIARQVCRSLREAHGLGVIHRDLKPANIYLVKHGDENDFVKVLDFGLVKNLGDTGEDLTQTGLFMGSPKYMSPEQIRGEKVDGRADIYALGVILYEMLTGKVPFDRPNSVNILMAHVHEAPPAFREANPDVMLSPELERIVLKAMAKRPEDRYASMDDMLAALKQGAVDNGLSLSRSIDLSTTGEFAALTGQHAPVIISGTPSAGSRVDPLSSASTDEVEPKKPPFLLIGGIAAAVLVAIGVTIALVAGGDEEPAVTPTPTTDSARGTEPATTGGTATTAGTSTGSAGTQTPATVSTLVTLRSTPAGATVRVGEREYGPTPASIEWTGADAERGRQVTFLFHLDGHRDYTVTRVITGDRLDVQAELESIQRAPRPSPVRRVVRPGANDGQPVGPVKGYKLDPY
jgi:serine/threonine-protein kinase